MWRSNRPARRTLRKRPVIWLSRERGITHSLKAEAVLARPRAWLAQHWEGKEIAILDDGTSGRGVADVVRRALREGPAGGRHILPL